MHLTNLFKNQQPTSGDKNSHLLKSPIFTHILFHLHRPVSFSFYVMTGRGVQVLTQTSQIQSDRFVMLPSNIPLLSALLAVTLAQFLKIFTTWFKEKRWDSKRMFSSGGMPSSHSAGVSALAVAIGLQEGTGGSAFALAVIMACIVMYDATGVRLHAGQQAQLLNQIVCELPPEHPASNIKPLRDSLGHTPLQVVAGAVLGCIIAYVMLYMGR